MRYAQYVVFVIFCFVSAQAFAEEGVNETEIVIGVSNAQEGPSKLLGDGISKGAFAYFRQLAARGGVFGRRVRMVQYDDGYEPERCLSNAKQLLDVDKAFVLFGFVGTPTCKAVVPLATRRKAPFLFPFTGAAFLRDLNEAPTVYNLRGDYDMETRAMVEHLVKQGKKRIAIFYQDDSYGAAGLHGTLKALKAHGLSLVGEGAYQRNTTAVNRALLSILKAKPEAVIMIGAYLPCAEFIKRARKLGLEHAVFINISFVGSNALAAALGPEGEGTLVTQVVPFPWNKELPAVREYHAALGQAYPEEEPGFVSFEGYLDAKLLVEGLRRVGHDLTRERFLRALEEMQSVDLGIGEEVGFSPFDHQGLKKVFLTKITRNGFSEVAP
jgi:ABC-type branched-subunit amino acid transport system substrate-binding protein